MGNILGLAAIHQTPKECRKSKENAPNRIISPNSRNIMIIIEKLLGSWQHLPIGTLTQEYNSCKLTLSF